MIALVYAYGAVALGLLVGIMAVALLRAEKDDRVSDEWLRRNAPGGEE